MTIQKTELGKKGEKLASDFLEKEGYVIIDKNYHYGHTEIDLIAKQNNILVFVEVKTRKSLEFGHPAESITRKKLKNILRTAEAYLYDKKISDCDCRIDVISILLLKDKDPEIEHFMNVN